MYDTVIFDYGNTLCKMGSIARTLGKVHPSKFAFQIGTLIEEYIEQLYPPERVSVLDWEAIWRTAFLTYGLPFDEDIGRKHLAQFASEGELYDYTIPVLESLKSRGIKMVLLANITGATEVFQQDLDARGLSRYFDRVIWTSEIGYRKPSPKAYQLALNSIGSSPATTLMVGNNIATDIEGASDLGISTLLLCDQHSVCSYADYVVIRSNAAEEIIRVAELVD
ncbi:HAD family hydrolase [Vibrio astriarenae]|uniref:HAD family hydrolase n=1 Tax=Vibrio astriarenae TaxID=1481923 RepID=UPI0037364B36